MTVAGATTSAVERRAADVDGTPRNGIVTVNCSPVSGLLVIWPSNGGSVVALLIMSTAAAPACWP